MRKKIKIIFVLLLVTSGVFSQSIGRQEIKIDYDSIIKGNSIPSLNQILKYSKSNNSYNFMAIGYFFDANNIMYQKTKDKKYLEANWQVYNSLFNKSQNKKSYYNSKWSINVNKSHSSANFNGMGSLVYEGYFFRYLANFYDILKKNNLYENTREDILEALVYTFNRWSKPSVKRYGDETNMYHQRLHIGSHWATVAMILHKYTNEKKYLTFYNDFNYQLKKALYKVTVNNLSCYQWYSTYPEKFTNGLKQNLNYQKALQDVSHGNHVIQYVIDSYNQGYGSWNKTDLQYFANTAKSILWSDNSKSFSALLNGKGSDDTDLKDAGIKLSDGWMKLMQIDPSLKNIFIQYYNSNKSKIINRFQGLQTLAVLYKYGI